MAKQTINIGSSPNDGTGTPLRTSFDYCNLNFTELYTAVGPSGNNIVCPGSATAQRFIPSSATVPTNGMYLPGANELGWAINSAEAMRLNATGLGVGGSPTRKLSIVGSGATYANINSGDNTSLVGLLLGGTSNPSAGQVIYDNTANSLALFTSGATRLTIDSSGNVGIGFTPSAWGNASKVVQVGQAGSVYGRASFGYYGTKFNLYNDNTNDIAITTNFIGEYRFEVLNGSHVWLNKSTAGSIGVAQTLTQAMTLDASGRLILLASTTTPATLATNGELTFTATSNTNLRFSYRGSDGVTRVANITLA